MRKRKTVKTYELTTKSSSPILRHIDAHNIILQPSTTGGQSAKELGALLQRFRSGESVIMSLREPKPIAQRLSFFLKEDISYKRLPDQSGYTFKIQWKIR